MYPTPALYMMRPPPSRTPSTASLPPRKDSIQKAAPAPPPPGGYNRVFEATAEDLRDVRRVRTHGQEEDLRYALDKMINRVEELTTLLRNSLAASTELDTQLTLARSNLQVALLNNEMLEDALKRQGTKDVGWTRNQTPTSPYPPSNLRPATPSEEQRRHTLPGPFPDAPVVTPATPEPASGFPLPTAPPSASTSSFFGSLTRPASRTHLTSASLPSLALPDGTDPSELLRRAQEEKDQAVNALRSDIARLEAEKKRLEQLAESGQRAGKEVAAARAEKRALEEELESLSQALFEEANRMVSQERRRLAEREEELREARMERDALKGALRVVDEENGRLRGSVSMGNLKSMRQGEASGFGGGVGRSRSSSETGTKSPRFAAVDEGSESEFGEEIEGSMSGSGRRLVVEEGAFDGTPTPTPGITPTPTQDPMNAATNAAKRLSLTFQAPTPPIPGSTTTTAPSADAFAVPVDDRTPGEKPHPPLNEDKEKVVRPSLLNRASSFASLVTSSRPGTPKLEMPNFRFGEFASNLPGTPKLELPSVATLWGTDEPWADTRSMSPRPLGAAFGRRRGTRGSEHSTASSRESLEKSGEVGSGEGSGEGGSGEGNEGGEKEKERIRREEPRRMDSFEIAGMAGGFQ